MQDINIEMVKVIKVFETVTVPVGDLMSMDDAARALGVPINTLSQWMDKCLLPVFIKPHQRANDRPQRFTSRAAVAEKRLFLSADNKRQPLLSFIQPLSACQTPRHAAPVVVGHIMN